MKYPYNTKFINENDFQNLLEGCSCSGNNDGSEMLLANLAKIHEYSNYLLNAVREDEELEDWISDKISKASQSLSDVKHYIEYKKSAHGSMNYAVEKNYEQNLYPAHKTVTTGEKLPVMEKQPVMTPQSAYKDEETCAHGYDTFSYSNLCNHDEKPDNYGEDEVSLVKIFTP